MSKKIQWLNDLRGLAVIMVLLSHLFIMFIVSPSTVSAITHTKNYNLTVLFAKILSLLQIGPLGVTIFFLVSGYVIAVSLDHKNTLNFLVGRFFRIYPLYWLSFTLCVCVIYFNSRFYLTTFGLSVHAIFIHYLVGFRDLIFSPQIDYIIWTLEIEVKFYIFMSVFYKAIRNNKQLSLALIFCISIILTRYSLSKPNITLPTDLSMQFAYIALMLIGTYAYFYHKDVHLKLIKVNKLITAVLVLFSAFTYMMFNNLWFINLSISTYISYIIGVIIFLIFYFIKPKKNRVLAWFADISYPLYLFHPILGYSIEYYLYAYLNVNIFISIAIAITTVILLAYIVHSLVELPLMRFSKKITR